jgi:hypothetical protein
MAEKNSGGGRISFTSLGILATAVSLDRQNPIDINI